MGLFWKTPFPFQNNYKELDLSCKTDLAFWDCFGKTRLLTEEVH